MSQATTIEPTVLEVVPPSALEAIERGTIDVQIATAHRFPRSMTAFKQRAVQMATLDEETAQSCLYSRPVGGGKFAEGLSVRLAEIVGASYGNLRVGAMIVEIGERRVVARGYAHDLESNFAAQTEVVESCVKRDGTPYDERMRVVIAKAALAKARRDATFQVVPKALCKPVESAVRTLLVGDGSMATITKRRANVMVWLNSLGIDLARVYAALQIGGEDDIGIAQLETLLGIRNAIKDSEASVDEAFPPIVAKGNVGKKTTPMEDAGKKKEPAQTQQKPTESATAETAKTDPLKTADAKPALKLKELQTTVTEKLQLEGIGKKLLVLHLSKIGKAENEDVPFSELSAETLDFVNSNFEAVCDAIRNAE